MQNFCSKRRARGVKGKRAVSGHGLRQGQLLLLNILKIKHQAEQPARRLRSGTDAAAARLAPEAIAPDWHFTRAMTADLVGSIDGSINLPKRKCAAVFIRDPGQVRWPHREILTHDAAAFAISAMTYGAIVLIFKLTARDELHFLRRGYPAPEKQKCGQAERQESPPSQFREGESCLSTSRWGYVNQNKH